jgi:hypothetical protein
MNYYNQRAGMISYIDNHNKTHTISRDEFNKMWHAKNYSGLFDTQYNLLKENMVNGKVTGELDPWSSKVEENAREYNFPPALFKNIIKVNKVLGDRTDNWELGKHGLYFFDPFSHVCGSSTNNNIYTLDQSLDDGAKYLSELRALHSGNLTNALFEFFTPFRPKELYPEGGWYSTFSQLFKDGKISPEYVGVEASIRQAVYATLHGVKEDMHPGFKEMWLPDVPKDFPHLSGPSDIKMYQIQQRKYDEYRKKLDETEKRKQKK